MKFRRLGPSQNLNQGNKLQLFENLLGDPGMSHQVRAIAVSSINGSATVNGVSGGLGNDLDFEFLLHLRAWADVVLVGSGTVLKEEYGGVALCESYQNARLARGQMALPPLAVISSSIPFTQESKIFSQTTTRPLLVTNFAGSQKATGRGLNSAFAEIICCDTTSPTDIISQLTQRGFERIVVEGGPSVYAPFFAHDAVDIFHHTIDPSVITTDATPLIPQIAPPTNSADHSPHIGQIKLRTEDVTVTEDGVIFVRYGRPSSQ